jgi:hypothetical protein
MANPTFRAHLEKRHRFLRFWVRGEHDAAHRMMPFMHDHVHRSASVDLISLLVLRLRAERSGICCSSSCNLPGALAPEVPEAVASWGCNELINELNRLHQCGTYERTARLQ